jgi:spore germination protein YaaH
MVAELRMPLASRRALFLLVVGSLLLGTVGSLGPAGPARAADPPRAPLVSGWLPSWATQAALAGVEGNADLFSDASPFWYTARASGGTTTVSTSVAASTRAAVLASLRSRGIPVIPSVADGSAARAMATVLKDPTARARHVAQLVDLAVANGFDGIELDYEKFAFSDGSSTWATTRPAWVAFVTQLGKALHAQGKKLALAVPPMYNGSRSSSSGYWVYDYAGVAPVVDSLRIMTYDYSVSRPGPISPLSFIRRTLSYAVTAFPAERIRMGVPAYGRLWVARRADGTQSITGTCPTGAPLKATSFTTATALSYLASRAGATPPVLRFDDPTGEMVATFRSTYTGTRKDGTPTSCDVDHQAWWVDARGVALRMALINEFRLAGAAVWQLGGVDAGSWAALRSFARSRTPAEPVATTVAVVAPRRHVAGSNLGLTVRVTSAEGGVIGAPVTLERRSVPSSTWRTVATVPTDVSGRAAFTISGLASTTSWRARVAASSVWRAAEGRASTKVAPKVAVKPSTLSPAPGATVTLKVRLTPKRRYVTVVRQMLVNGAWRTMASKQTNAKGRVTFTIQWPKAPTANTYRVITRKTDGLVAGESPRFSIKTR